ncbi:hypothetical protein KAFR_0K00610 [Kazachstania africana CBS 2517]|uniref:Uncharacterized protein n=1 Tax=Kazachstania africana (strain ATCC 22294 / BCRC 22015 / CBS 2517 / CECT 1963 / NBRC 1671 / NRRL Y-8276) TaxID=1071382 RepID=H2B1B6_KAZAF|nr:hypothetical protein KAFR_0K00610 [Kazachstania africana CBS 2517]CCF60416.1 hypothetical protein KAFR_0K00610 [Kazachstania africana CBS 2517]
MDLLIARIEDAQNGGGEKVALDGAVRVSSVKHGKRGKHTNPEHVSQKSGHSPLERGGFPVDKDIKLPSIAINDKPVLVRHSSERTLASLPQRERHHIRHRGRRPSINDYTPVSAGMFSECMFDTELKSPAEEILMPEKEKDSSGGVATSTTTTTTKQGLPCSLLQDGSKPSSASLAQGIFSTHVCTHDQRQSGKFGNNKHRHQNKLFKDGSGSEIFNNDNKRLVNQFLRSIDASSSLQLGRRPVKFKAKIVNCPSKKDKRSLIDKSNPSERSLQSLLYHDLEGSGNDTSEDLAGMSLPNYSSSYGALSDSISSSDPESSDSESSSSSLDLSRSDIRPWTNSYSSSESGPLDSTEDTVYGEGNVSSEAKSKELKPPLNKSEMDYYQRHITLTLQKAEYMIKTSLKDTIVKREADLQKTVQYFDNLTRDLQDLKNRVIGLKVLVRDDYLQMLRQEFNSTLVDSFEAQLTKAVTSKVDQLEKLENRMSVCQIRVAEQKEILRKFENLFTLEDSLILSRKKVTFASKYRYVLYDIISSAFLLSICLVLKRLVWG